ncbi:MAG: hypothetical protein HY720_22660 [Planctomycetes bacterium]|nr:hypothetical protein [Planctomycetota bacterium]
MASASPGIEVSPREGTAPAVLAVTGSGAGSSIRPFRIEVESDGKHLVAVGTLLTAEWDVRWFPWTKDPREDAPAFEALVAGDPIVRKTFPALDFPWQGGGPEGVPADRFATVAETTLTLPAGRYRIRTVSDDGVRVKVDGTTVLENWTWHGPTEDTAEEDLSAGEHRVRVEHFELDGWAVLRCSLEPASAHR